MTSKHEFDDPATGMEKRFGLPQVGRWVKAKAERQFENIDEEYRGNERERGTRS